MGGPAAIAAYAVIGWWLALTETDCDHCDVVTHDGLVIAGSETGMVVVPDTNIAERGRLGPGEMIGINLSEGRIYKDHELKDKLVKKCDWRQWIGRAKQMDSLLANASGKASAPLDPKEGRRRQFMAGWTMEDTELVLQPMAQTGKEAIGSMGDDTPLAVLSGHYRGLHHFFRQNFSQVTNPPIDSLRERHVMSLRTRLGNLGNILDEVPEQCDHLLLQSPILTVRVDALCFILVTRQQQLIAHLLMMALTMLLPMRLIAFRQRLKKRCDRGVNMSC